jgi:hypothetical protein
MRDTGMTKLTFLENNYPSIGGNNETALSDSGICGCVQLGDTGLSATGD